MIRRNAYIPNEFYSQVQRMTTPKPSRKQQPKIEQVSKRQTRDFVTGSQHRDVDFLAAREQVPFRKILVDQRPSLVRAAQLSREAFTGSTRSGSTAAAACAPDTEPKIARRHAFTTSTEIATSRVKPFLCLLLTVQSCRQICNVMHFALCTT